MSSRSVTLFISSSHSAVVYEDWRSKVKEYLSSSLNKNMIIHKIFDSLKSSQEHIGFGGSGFLVNNELA